MDIVIRADLRIHGGPKQWEIQRLRVRMKDGERVGEWQAFSWHPRLSQAVREVGEMELRSAASIREALARLDRLESALQLLTRRAEQTVGEPGGAAIEGRAP